MIIAWLVTLLIFTVPVAFATNTVAYFLAITLVIIWVLIGGWGMRQKGRSLFWSFLIMIAAPIGWIVLLALRAKRAQAPSTIK